MTQFLQTLFDGATVGCLYALIALGYTMVYGILKFINFAHSDVFALGAWMSITIAGWIGINAAADTPPPWYAGLAVLVLSMLFCGAVGFVIERMAYKPLRQSPRLNVLITAIGVSLLLQNIGQLKFVFGPYPKRFPMLLSDASLFNVGGVQVRIADVAVIVTTIVLMAGMQFLIYHTRIGMGMRAVSFNNRTASLMGVNVDRVISATFVVGAMLAAAAGFLYGVKYSGQANQTADALWVMLGLKAFVAAVVGGIGNVRGAVLGGLLIGLIEFFGSAYISSQFRDAYVFAILIVVLLLRPEGVLGRATVEKV
jgi:branched-chain amino acid transport system permease protein